MTFLSLFYSRRPLMQYHQKYFIILFVLCESLLFISALIALLLLLPNNISPIWFFNLLKSNYYPLWDFHKDGIPKSREIEKSPVRYKMGKRLPIIERIDFLTDFMLTFRIYLQLSSLMHSLLVCLLLIGLFIVFVSFICRIMLIMPISIAFFGAYVIGLLVIGSPSYKFNEDVLKNINIKIPSFDYHSCLSCHHVRRPKTYPLPRSDRILFEMQRFDCCGWKEYNDITKIHMGPKISPLCCKNFSLYRIDWTSAKHLNIPLIDSQRVLFKITPCDYKDTKIGCYFRLKDIWKVHYPLLFSVYFILDLILFSCAALVPIFIILIIILFCMTLRAKRFDF